MKKRILAVSLLLLLGVGCSTENNNDTAENIKEEVAIEKSAEAEEVVEKEKINERESFEKIKEMNSDVYRNLETYIELTEIIGNNQMSAIDAYDKFEDMITDLYKKKSELAEVKVEDSKLLKAKDNLVKQIDISIELLEMMKDTLRTTEFTEEQSETVTNKSTELVLLRESNKNLIEELKNEI